MLDALDRVFADTTLFCRFEASLGGDGLRALLDFFDASLCIAIDVHRELINHARGDFLGLQILLGQPLQDEFLRAPPHGLEPEQAVKVNQIARQWGTDPRRSRKDFGEIATVLLAEAYATQAIIDDRSGRALAKRRNVGLITTRDVAVEMTLEGAVSESDGLRIWDTAFSTDTGVDHFERALKMAQRHR